MTREPETPARRWPTGQLVLGLLLLFICSGVFFPRQITLVVLAVFMIVPILLLIFTFNGLIYGLVWGVKISTAIAKTYEASIFDVLSLSPAGALGATWAMGTGCLYRNREFGDLNFPETWTIRLFVVIFASMALGTLSGARRANELVLPVLVYALVLIAAFYVDDIQSIVLGSLAGMLTPLYARNRVDARLWTMGLYLLVQVMTYLSVLLIGFVFLPAFSARVSTTGLHSDIALPLLGFTVFYGIREFGIALLWNHLARRLNADPREFRLDASVT
jgi:hypothetical protein